MKYKINNHKKLNYLFLTVSVSISAVLFLVIKNLTFPYRVESIYKQNPPRNSLNELYHDFDKNGYSEKITVDFIRNRLFFYDYHTSPEQKVKDQFNFIGEINHDWIYFGDYTADGYDDVFVFSQNGDSLYLSALDVNLKKWIIQESFVLSVQKPNPYNKWDMGVYSDITDCLLDVNSDGKKEIVFSVSSGLSHHPRGVYVYNIEQRSIINSFTSNAKLNLPFHFDLNSDGKKEIIVTSHASGNIRDRTNFSDWECWLFAFDQNLEPIFPPKNFSQYPANLLANPVSINQENYLLVNEFYHGNKIKENYIYLINHKGEIVRKNSLSSKGYFKPFRKNLQTTKIYSSSHDNYLRIWDTDLNIVTEKKVNFNMNRLIYITDLNIDGKHELIVYDYQDFLHVLNEDLEEIARLNVAFIQSSSLRLNGNGNPLHLSFYDNEYFYLTSLEENIFYSYLPIIAFCFSGVLFMILVLVHKVFSFLYIYFSYFLFSLKSTDNGLIILNPNGQIIYLNSRIQKYLNLSEQIMKKADFKQALGERENVIECIQKTIESGQVNTCELIFNQPDFQFKGEITVTPFSSKFKMVYAYLVEIKDYTKPIMSDRLQVWSKGVQKIAHDIKTPLSSIGLNLRALQKRLEKSDIKDSEDVDDDINMIHEELERIRSLTKGFLKFSNLEKPNLQFNDLEKIIVKSINHFKTYLDAGLQIQTKLDHKTVTVLVDAVQIGMVFHILIENAIDAMQGKGIIEISVTEREFAQDVIKKFVQIEIADNGPGISSGSKEKIFEPYFTSKKDGTGMGLAIAKKIIEDHGGKLAVNSSKLGTVMWFTVETCDITHDNN